MTILREELGGLSVENCLNRVERRDFASIQRRPATCACAREESLQERRVCACFFLEGELQFLRRRKRFIAVAVDCCDSIQGQGADLVLVITQFF